MTIRLFTIKATALTIFYLIGSLSAYSQNSAQQTLNATLPEVLEISKVIVESKEYPRNSMFDNVTIKSVDTTNPNIYPLGLSPMVVEIRTNLSTPIYVTAEFQELKHALGSYDFPVGDLSFSPQTYTINNPYDGVQTGVYTPVAVARTVTVPGEYLGKVLFTLGAI